MRVLVRPLCFFALVCGFAATAQSQPAALGSAESNQLYWAANSPSPTIGGVDASAIEKPTTGYTCTDVTLRVIDDQTGKTLDSYTDNNPGDTVSKSFTGLESGLRVQVTADATFKCGATFDPKFITADVTTK
jgi:hypothetical protein